MTETNQLIFTPPITRKLVGDVADLLGIDLNYDELTRVDSDGIGKTREALKKMRNEIL